MAVNESARDQLVGVINQLLSEWEAGRDWKWHGGQLPYGIGLDDIDLDKSDPDYNSLSATWHFVDAFEDARWHGFPKLDGLSWEEALQLITDTGQRLRMEMPIQDPRVLRYV